MLSPPTTRRYCARRVRVADALRQVLVGDDWLTLAEIALAMRQQAGVIASPAEIREAMAGMGAGLEEQEHHIPRLHDVDRPHVVRQWRRAQAVRQREVAGCTATSA